MATATSVQPSQHFYSLTLEHASAPVAAVVCQVLPDLSANDQQIFEARGTRVYLRQIVETPNEELGNQFSLELIFEQDVFSIVRSVAALRIPGSKLDHLVISSDSGRLAIFEYDVDANRLVELPSGMFGKSGVRRTIPGQYLAVDNDGRCCMVASTEKNKLVHMLTRHVDGSIVVSSPHEANTWATICYDLVAVDVGTENPIFAALEVEYSESEGDETGLAYREREKMLSYYTVDLGLNHVVRTWTDSVDYSANKLFAVPGGDNGPSGVIVCAKGRLYYKHEKWPTMSIAIPRRQGPLEDPNRDRMIVSGCVFVKSKRQGFWLFLQTDDGDVFKLTLEFEDDSWTPSAMKIRYFETLPTAKFMIGTKRSFVYIAAESGPTKVYQIDDIDDEEAVEPHNVHTSEDISPDWQDQIEPIYFQHRGLQLLIDRVSLPALHPLIKTKVENIFGEEAPQILALQGSGNTSSLKLMKHGNSVSTYADVLMGAIPLNGIWSLSDTRASRTTTLLLVSSKYADTTQVLNVDSDNIQGAEQTPFMTGRATILAAMMGDATKVQVHARGVLSVYADGRVSTWNSPGHCTISCAGANERQLLLGLSSAELSFFFLDVDGVLRNMEDTPEMSGAITAIGLANTPHGRAQAKYAVVGCDDNTVRVMSILTETPLEVRSIQAVSAPPVSIVVTEMLDPNSDTNVTVAHIGLQSGLYLRAIIDEVTGDLSQTRIKFLGTKPVHITPAVVAGQQCVILTSTKTWIGYHHPTTKQYTTTPLDMPGLDSVAEFISANTHGGLCGVGGTNLLVFGPDQLGQRFVTDEVTLRYTPRNMTRHPTEGLVYVIESDANTMSDRTAQQQKVAAADSAPEYLEGAVLGNPKAPGHWASCIQIVDPVVQKAVLSTIHLDENEAALCCAVVAFESKNWEAYLMVGTGRNMHNSALPAAQRGGFVRTYKLLNDGKELKLIHKTELPEPIYALIPFKGRIAIGIGREVCIYDLGMQHVLRKARGHAVPHMIVSLDTMGNRIVCGDVSESVTYVVYNEEFNRLIPFVDDTVSRWTTAVGMVDYDTVAGGDKFGNIWVMRCPEDISREADDPGQNGYIMNERPYMGGTPYRLENRAHFFTQDIPMSVQRTPLVPGGQEVLFWAGLQGTLGMLVPFVSRRDVIFFTQLELQVRQEDKSITGRDHLAYRSYYSPVRSVIDGDLCERFLELSYDSKQRIAAECERDVAEVEKKIQEMRDRVSF